MKKIMMIAAMMLMSIGAFAQEGAMSVGAHLGYAGYGDGYSPLGLGARFQYGITESIRGELDGNFWFKKNEVGLWDANVNLQYLFPVAEDIKIYPLLGVTFMGTHGLDENETAFGFNIGAGAEYILPFHLALYGSFGFLPKGTDNDFDEWELEGGTGYKVGLNYYLFPKNPLHLGLSVSYGTVYFDHHVEPNAENVRPLITVDGFQPLMSPHPFPPAVVRLVLDSLCLAPRMFSHPAAAACFHFFPVFRVFHLFSPSCGFTGILSLLLLFSYTGVSFALTIENLFCTDQPL